MSLPPLIIDDSTPPTIWTPPADQSTGLQLGRRGPAEYAYGSAAERFPANLRIPREQWADRIRDILANRQDIRSHLKDNGIGPKNQKQTNYCWIFGPTRAFEITRVLQGQEWVSLSPASAGAQIKNFRNDGGWGLEGIQFIAEKGLVPSNRWPDTAWNDRSLLTEENKRIALDYRATEWWELARRNMDDLVSCLLRGIPVAVGYDWWGHEVCAVGAIWNGVNSRAKINTIQWVYDSISLLILNSWDDWGDEGYGILKGSKMVADDQVAPRVAMAA